MIENNSGVNGSGGTGRRRSTFYVALSENVTSSSVTNSSENKETLEKTSNTKMSPSRRLSNSSQTLTLMEPEKSSASRRISTSKSPSQVLPSKSPTKLSQVSAKIGTKQSPVNAPQPLKACTRTIQGPQLLKVAPPQSPKSPKKSSSLLQLSSTKSLESSLSPQKTSSRPLQLSLSLRRTPSTRTTVVVTSRDSPKSSVRNVSVAAKATSTVLNKVPSTDRPKKIPLVVVDQHNSGKDVKTADRQEAKHQQQQTRQANKDVDEDDANDPGVHSGESVQGNLKFSLAKRQNWMFQSTVVLRSVCLLTV